MTGCATQHARRFEELLSIDYSYYMDLSVADFAHERGISRQRALALIHSGQIDARRIGRAWVIDQRELNRRVREGRPLSGRMSEIVIDVISGRPRPDLSSQDRFFASRYLDRLRSSDSPASLIHSWMKSRHVEVIDVAANLVDLAQLAQDNRVLPSGVSDERAEISSAHEFEGYVASADIDAVVSENLLVPSRSPNVRLHVVNVLPRRPIALGFVIADLADWNRPREDARLVELLKGAPWNH